MKLMGGSFAMAAVISLIGELLHLNHAIPEAIYYLFLVAVVGAGLVFLFSISCFLKKEAAGEYLGDGKCGYGFW